MTFGYWIDFHIKKFLNRPVPSNFMIFPPSSTDTGASRVAQLVPQRVPPASFRFCLSFVLLVLVLALVVQLYVIALVPFDHYPGQALHVFVPIPPPV